MQVTTIIFYYTRCLSQYIVYAVAALYICQHGLCTCALGTHTLIELIVIYNCLRCHSKLCQLQFSQVPKHTTHTYLYIYECSFLHQLHFKALHKHTYKCHFLQVEVFSHIRSTVGDSTLSPLRSAL